MGDARASGADGDALGSINDPTAQNVAPTLFPLSVEVAHGDEDDGAVTTRVLQFECDWDVGIGGSVWTSGEILSAHLQLQRRRYCALFDGKRVVELGSGTGFVGLAVAACFRPAHVFLTDLSTHLACLERNAARNQSVVQNGVNVHVKELSWGSAEHETALQDALAAASTDGARTPDVIIGTDVAYLRELYAPLQHTLRALAADSSTLVLLGLNRADTGMAFFQQLERDGFEYYKIRDEELPAAYWGKDFGLFEIRRARPR